jgi:glycosyltransferase involved in cell wall biosynthesis
MAFATDELSANSKGGTELLRDALAKWVSPELLDKFHITLSRVRDIDRTRIPLFWAHDLPGDPESQFMLGGGYNKFKKLVFVSNWQWQQYHAAYNIPWHKGEVLLNAIEPFGRVVKPEPKPIRLIYHSTPHRGLDILYSVFAKLCETHDDIELDVYSSFELYGWKERDEPYRQLFEALKFHPKIRYHGTQPNEVIREALTKAHIFAYPSTWPETSCLCLMEAMAAGCVCVHPNYAALYETAANWTRMYQWRSDKNQHAQEFYRHLDAVIQLVRMNGFSEIVGHQSDYANGMYSWDMRAIQWTSFLERLVAEG